MRGEDTRSWFSHLLYKLGCVFSRLQLPPSLPSPRHGTCPAKRAVSLVPWPGHVLLVDPRGVTLQPGLRCSDHLVQALQREDWLHWVVSPPYPRKMSQNLAEPTQKRVIKIKKYFWPPPGRQKYNHLVTEQGHNSPTTTSGMDDWWPRIYLSCSTGKASAFPQEHKQEVHLPPNFHTSTFFPAQPPKSLRALTAQARADPICHISALLITTQKKSKVMGGDRRKSFV